CLGFSAGSWIVSTAISCFSAAACNLACKSCNCNNSIATRVGYALAWLMLSDWAIKQLEKITHLHLNCPEETCYGVLAVHRICFALSLFHLILGLLVFKVNSTRDKRSSIQNGTILSIHPVIQEENSRSGLSQASMVAFYCTYLILICNPLLDTANGTRVTTVVIGALFTFMAIAYSTSRAATQDITSGTRSGSLLAAVENGNTIQITGSDELVIIGRSLISVWVKVVCSWICLLLYFWSLLAPVLLPERFEV
ncbi:3107_t:CDS:2, partial [Entrophospora sp. SA101]